MRKCNEATLSPFVNSPIFILPYSHITFPARGRLPKSKQNDPSFARDYSQPRKTRKPRSRAPKRLEKGDLRNSQTTNMPLQLCDRFEHFSPRASHLRSNGCFLAMAKSSNRSRWVFENRVTPFRVLPCLPWLKPNPSKTNLRLTAIILNHGSSRKPRFSYTPRERFELFAVINSCSTGRK